MIIPPGFAEITYGWRQAAGYRESLTSCGFVIAGWDQDVEPLFNDWGLQLASMGLPTTVSASSTTVKVGTSNPSAPLTFEFTGSDGGSGSATLMPPSVSMLLVKRTLLGGRKGRGRMFLPAPPENQVDNVGNIDSTYRGNVEATMITMLEAAAGALADEGAQPVLLHTDDTEPTDITTFALSGVIASQRRRLVRASS